MRLWMQVKKTGNIGLLHGYGPGADGIRAVLVIGDELMDFGLGEIRIVNIHKSKRLKHTARRLAERALAVTDGS